VLGTRQQGAAVALHAHNSGEFVRPLKGRRISASCKGWEPESGGDPFLTVQDRDTHHERERESALSPGIAHRSASQLRRRCKQAATANPTPSIDRKANKPGTTDAFRRVLASRSNTSCWQSGRFTVRAAGRMKTKLVASGFRGRRDKDVNALFSS